MSSSDRIDGGDLLRDVGRVFDAHLARPAWRCRRASKTPVESWARRVDDARLVQLVCVECWDQCCKVNVLVKVRGFNLYWFGKPDSGLFVPRDSVIHVGPMRAPTDPRSRLFRSSSPTGACPSMVGELTQFIRQDLHPFLDEMKTAADVLLALAPDAPRHTHGFVVWEPLTPNLTAATRACVLAALGQFDDAVSELRELRAKYYPEFVDMLLRHVAERKR